MTQDNANETDTHDDSGLESGLLQRVREWTDLFPWLRLVRVLRIAASPTMLVLTAATLVFWIGGFAIFSESLGFDAIRKPSELSAQISMAGLVWTLTVWTPAAICLTRQGGLLAAGRSLGGIRSVLSLGARRCWRGWVSAAIPFAGAFLVSLVIWPIGWIGQATKGVVWMEIPLGALAGLAAIPAGVVAFGGVVAVPLSWAALGNEKDSDPLNALSRGYESLFRRPLHLTFYLLVSTGFGWVILMIAEGISFASTLVATSVLELTGCSPQVASVTSSALTAVPAVVVATLGGGFLGGIYLLLRYDTGGQEIEDLWETQEASAPPLPALPTQ